MTCPGSLSQEVEESETQVCLISEPEHVARVSASSCDEAVAAPVTLLYVTSLLVFLHATPSCGRDRVWVRFVPLAPGTVPAMGLLSLHLLLTHFTFCETDTDPSAICALSLLENSVSPTCRSISVFPKTPYSIDHQFNSPSSEANPNTNAKPMGLPFCQKVFVLVCSFLSKSLLCNSNK